MSKEAHIKSLSSGKDRYDRFLVKNNIQLPPENSLDINERKRIIYSTKPVHNRIVLERFQRAYHRIRCVLSWKFMIEEIKLFGTGSRLFTVTFAYKKNISTVMNNKKLKKDTESPKTLGNSKVKTLHPHNSLSQSWSFFILLLLLYSFITVPWLIAFENKEEERLIFIIDRSIDICFCMDIIVTLNTSLIGKNKEIISSRKLILFTYAKRLLIFDALTVCPFWMFVELGRIKYFRAFRLLKIVRVLKVAKFGIILKKFPFLGKFLNKAEGVSRLLAGLLIVIIMTHFIACFWNYAAYLYSYDEQTWIVRNGLMNKNNWERYLAALYFSFSVLMTVGFGDIHAITQTEMIICIIWEFIGIAFYSFVFGSISSVLTSLDQKNATLARKIQLMELFSRETQLSSNLRREILKEINDSSSILVLDYDEKLKLVSNLPKKLKYKICVAMYEKAVERVYFFQNKPLSFVADIMPRLIYLQKKDHELLYAKNHFADEMYFLISGKVSFIFGKDNLVFKSMIAGSYFGEIELIEEKQRDFGAMTVGECSLLAMPKFVFDYMMIKYPRISDDIKEVAEIKKVKINSAMQDIIELLVNVDVKKEKRLSEMAGTLKPYQSKEYSRPRISSESKNLGYLYGLEYENRYLKFNVAQLNAKIDRLNNRLREAILFMVPNT